MLPRKLLSQADQMVMSREVKGHSFFEQLNQGKQFYDPVFVLLMYSGLRRESKHCKSL